MIITKTATQKHKHKLTNTHNKIQQTKQTQTKQQQT